MTTAEEVARLIKQGMSTRQALTDRHSRKLQNQMEGFPAIWRFPDGSELVIFGRGKSRLVKTR